MTQSAYQILGQGMARCTQQVLGLPSSTPRQSPQLYKYYGNAAATLFPPETASPFLLADLTRIGGTRFGEESVVVHFARKSMGILHNRVAGQPIAQCLHYLDDPVRWRGLVPNHLLVVFPEVMGSIPDALLDLVRLGFAALKPQGTVSMLLGTREAADCMEAQSGALQLEDIRTDDAHTLFPHSPFVSGSLFFVTAWKHCEMQPTQAIVKLAYRTFA